MLLLRSLAVRCPFSGGMTSSKYDDKLQKRCGLCPSSVGSFVIKTRFAFFAC